ncbi:hypothetical protein ACFYOV_21060 [Streptomyces sp. NPDC005931]|uniref:hypothetical protein n=1 Tax=Streptomyces sp. NPDC005931 TaxID=3364737 RepID=UPI0036C5BB16
MSEEGNPALLKSHRRLTTVLGVTAASASALVLATAPAQADGYVYEASNSIISSEVTAKTYFAQDGEILTALDMLKDGHGTAAQWRYNSSSATHSYYNGNGYAVPKDWNLSFAEGTTLQIRACLQDGSSGTPYRCGGWEYAKA